MDHDLSYEAYLPDSYEWVRQTCLYLAPILGAVLDELTVVGGMVPSLLITERTPHDRAVLRRKLL